MSWLKNFFHRRLRLPYQLNVYVDQRADRPRSTILLLHGIGNSGAAWDEVVRLLPGNLRVISIDLLGFGGSPSPRWARYDASTQARSVMATMARLGVREQFIVVGHSMGALVAIEIAKRYPWFVRSLVLCSPPLYTTIQQDRHLRGPDARLREFYGSIRSHPKELTRLVPLAVRMKIVGRAFSVTPDNVEVFMAALQASIIHQTSFTDVQRLRKPIALLYGRYDPVIVRRNIKQVAQHNRHVRLNAVAAGHEISGAYVSAVVSVIKDSLPNK